MALGKRSCFGCTINSAPGRDVQSSNNRLITASKIEPGIDLCHI